MSKLGSALGKKYEENRLSVLTRSFELGDHTFKVRVPSVQEIEAIYNYFKKKLRFSTSCGYSDLKNVESYLKYIVYPILLFFFKIGRIWSFFYFWWV